MRLAIALPVALALALALAAPASGQDAPPAPEATPAEADAEVVPEVEGDGHDQPITERRARRDYDARPDEGPDAGEVFLWVPRVIFAPVTFVLDYVLRRPIGLFAETAERENWDAFILDTFTWNQRRSGILPTFMVAAGLQPSVGLVFFSNDDVAPGHHLGASITFGGIDFVEGGGSYTIRSGNGFVLSARGEGGQRPDRVFSGIGWDAQSTRYRFREAWYDAQVAIAADRFWRESFLELRTGVDGHDFDPNGYAALANDAPPLSEALAQGVFPEPAGLSNGYAVSRTRVSIAIDSREIEPAPGHGVRVQAGGELVVDLVDPARRRWARYGGGIGSFVDLGHRRVIGLWGIARFADPLGSDEIPFTDLIALGEEQLLMQGFLQGQLRGRSAVAATLEYLYPIWTRLDGRLHLSIGNVFGEHLRDFALDRLRLSFGLGIATAGTPDRALQVAIAAGTAPFVDGASIDSIQLVFGTRNGF